MPLRRPGLLFICLLLVLNACQAPQFLPAARPPGVRQQAQNSATQLWEPTLRGAYQDVFAEHDRNQSGQIEPAEAAHAPRGLAQLDHNRDGALSPAETLPEGRYFSLMIDLLTQPPRPARSDEDPRVQMPTPAEIQRFRESLNQISDRPETRSQVYPVLLVPGYAEPSWYFMYGIYRELKQQGWAVEGINLFPNFAPAEEQARKVKAKVEEMLQRYGTDKIELVVHSFGGLISRYYIQEMGGQTQVRNLVTIATPHHGTYTAYLGPGESAVQLRPGSDFIEKLNANGYIYPPVRYTAIWSNTDEIVIPPRHAIMPGATVHAVPWTGHLTIMFSERTYGFIREALLRP